MRRRDFIKGITGSIIAWPLAAHAQQLAMPMIGFLGPDSAQTDAFRVAAFRQGLSAAGFVEGQNVAIEYRWAESHYDRLPALAADLVRRQVALIFAGGTPAAFAAKAATAIIPIVFEVASDPVELGLVASLSRPGGNMTGATQMSEAITPKRLQLLHELLPAARVMALLVNPTNPILARPQVREVTAAAGTLGLELYVLEASAERDLDAAFAKVTEVRAAGLVIGGDTFFSGHDKQLAALAVQHAVPTIYQRREFATAGGLMSYGPNVTDTLRLAGGLAARILKGDKPADLPVQAATRIGLYINLKTAKALGIEIPLSQIGRADEVFE